MLAFLGGITIGLFVNSPKKTATKEQSKVLLTYLETFNMLSMSKEDIAKQLNLKIKRKPVFSQNFTAFIAEKKVGSFSLAIKFVPQPDTRYNVTILVQNGPCVDWRTVNDRFLLDSLNVTKKIEANDAYVIGYKPAIGYLHNELSMAFLKVNGFQHDEGFIPNNSCLVRWGIGANVV